MLRALRYYRQSRLFTDHEAWLLFKLAAFAEAIGWTLLIGGIFVKYHLMDGNDIPVKITGQIHGMLFFAYIIAALLCGPSLRWSMPRIILAGLCSIPPYGSLLYEQCSAWLRSQESAKARLLHSYYTKILSV